jgi:hypothetical protein
MKRGKLSQVEKFYIKNNPDVPADEVAKILDRTEGVVKKFRSTLKQNEEPEVEEMKKIKEDRPVDPDTPDTESPTFAPSKGKTHELMGKRREATVMTPAASEYGDATRPFRTGKGNQNKAIFKPRG